MKKQLFVWILAVVMVGVCLTACGTADQKGTPSAGTKPPAVDTGSSDAAGTGDAVDLAELYQAGMDTFAAKNQEAPVLFQETDLTYLDNFYHGIAGVELKQCCFAMAPVTNAPMEVAMVEVADSKDVQTVMEIFQARVDEMSQDNGYPENSAAWKNNAKVTSRGNYVFLAVMTDEYSIPAEFILD